MTLVRIFRRTALTVALLGLAGCAATPVTRGLTEAPPPGLPAKAELAEVPFFPQTEYYCGPAALAAALKASGRDVTPDEIGRAVYTPGRAGTLQTEILSGSRRYGRLAVPIRSMDAGVREVAAGNPVLLLQNLSLDIAPQWHYALLVGYDLGDETAILRSGTIRRHVMDLETLEHTWGRAGFWGVVIALPEGPVPVTASLADWLSAAVGLERAGRPADAFRAYLTAAWHWPAAAAPLVSMANIQIGFGDLGGAEASLRQARRREPDNAIVLNNLAHVLMRRGKLVEAEDAARSAVAAGGRFAEAARETLAEVRERRAASNSGS